MTDSPEMAAYRAARPDLDILMRGGVFNVREPMPPMRVDQGFNVLSVTDGTPRTFQYKARRICTMTGMPYEVYSVETGEVVGRIN